MIVHSQIRHQVGISVMGDTDNDVSSASAVSPWFPLVSAPSPIALSSAVAYEADQQHTVDVEAPPCHFDHKWTFLMNLNFPLQVSK